MSPEITTMADSSLQPGSDLQELSILDFFDVETSPILVFDVQSSALAYENDAFKDWKRVNQQESLACSQPAFLDQVLERAKNTTHEDVAMAGRTWRTKLLKKRWMVLSSHERAATTMAIEKGVPPTPPADQAVPPIPTQSSSLVAVSDSVLTECTTLDWTRYDIQNISAHNLSIKQFPWHETSTGGIENWSEGLRSLVIAVCANSEPRVIIWGPDHVLIYNEACAPLFGDKHPCIGVRAEDTWSEAWPALAAFVVKAENEGEATKVAGMPVTMHRHGYDEEAFFNANFLPFIGADGKASGVVDEFTEVTTQVVQERRRSVIVKTSEILTHTRTLEELWDGFIDGVEQAVDDIPYAAIYVPSQESQSQPARPNVSSTRRHQYTMRGSVGVSKSAGILPDSFEVYQGMSIPNALTGALHEAWKKGEIVTLQHSAGSLPDEMAVGIPGRASGATVSTVCLLPIPDLFGGTQLAFAIIALTPRRPHDGNAILLVRSLFDVLTRASSTIFLPDEQRRARQRFEKVEMNLSQQLIAKDIEAGQLEQRYKRIIEDCPVGVYNISVDEKLVYCNDAYLDFTGTGSDVQSRAARPGDLVHEDDYERVMDSWTSAVVQKKPISLEYRLKKKWRSIDPASGDEVTGDTWLLASAAPELDDEGNVTHVRGWMLDISQNKYHEAMYHKRLEEEQAEVRFARLAATAPHGMYLMKIDGTPMYLNEAYYELMGITKQEFDMARRTGVGWSQAIYEEDQHIVDEAWQQLQQGNSIICEYRVKRPWKAYDKSTGTEMEGATWLQSTAYCEKDKDGNLLAFQGFVKDISEVKFAERLLAERLEDALETKRQADRFIDMTSHEMRNPLSAILQSADGILTAIGFDNTLRSLSLDHGTSPTTDMIETVLDAAQTIIFCAQHQKRIVDDILTLSKLDSNLLVICPDRCELPALIEKSFKMYEAEIECAEIDVSLVLEDGYRALGIGDVMLDSSRVLQVVINLLTNAIKFTQYSARRTIEIYLNASADRPAQSNHHAEFIKQRADRADRTSSAEWGTGEELYLQIAVQDSGRGLNAEELGQLFHRFAQASPKTYKQYGGSGLGLFISRELTELQGGQIGVSSVAGEGSVFTFYVKARRASNDRSMEAELRRGSRSTSRKLSRENPPPPIQKVGAFVQPPQPNRRPSLFLPPPQREPSVTRFPIKTSTGLHILVVEDNEINQRVMATQLRRLGCTVHIAQHGLECLDFLRTTTFWTADAAASASSHPTLDTTPYDHSVEAVELDLILMDLEMPVLGGLACVEQIRDLERQGLLNAHVPTIAVTANARSEQIAVAVKSGMDSVVTKPFRIPELVPIMESVVARWSEQGEGGERL